MTSFQAHVKRAYFQAALGRAAGESSPPELNPVHYGWQLEHLPLRPALRFDDQLPAPEENFTVVNWN